MSIKKYTNFEQIDVNVDNKGKFLQAEDLFIVSKNEIEETDFGDCKYDVMEVSVYDINSNLLPHKSGKSVAYIKTGDIKNYMYNVTNKGGQKELAIDIEKLLINRSLRTENTVAIEIDELCAHDIDNENDWKLAELKYNLFFNEKI